MGESTSEDRVNECIKRKMSILKGKWDKEEYRKEGPMNELCVQVKNKEDWIKYWLRNNLNNRNHEHCLKKREREQWEISEFGWRFCTVIWLRIFVTNWCQIPAFEETGITMMPKFAWQNSNT